MLKRLFQPRSFDINWYWQLFIICRGFRWALWIFCLSLHCVWSLPFFFLFHIFLSYCNNRMSNSSFFWSPEWICSEPNSLSVSLWLTEEDGHRLTAGANAGAGDRCHLHLVEHPGHQALKDGRQHAPIHRPVDVVTSLVVSAAAAAHTPNLERRRRWTQYSCQSLVRSFRNCPSMLLVWGRICIFIHWWNSQL